MTRRTAIRRLLLATAALVGIAIAVPLAGLLLAQTDAGRAWIADEASAMASDDRLTVRISGLRGSVPFDFSIARIEVARDGRPLADIRGLALAWKPLALLAGRLHVETLAVGAADIGEVGADDPAPAEPAGSGGVTLPVDVRIDRLTVDRLRLAEFAGARPELSLTAAVRVRRDLQEVEADIDARRLDTAGHLRARLRHRAAPAQFELHADLLDAPGGVLAHLAGRPGLPEIRLAIDGSGPPENWRGKVAASAGGDPLLQADLDVAAGRETRVGLSGTADPRPLVPPDVAALIGAQTRLSATLRLAGDGALTVDALDVAAGRFRVGARGRYALADGSVDATAALTLAAPGAASGETATLPGGVAVGEAALTVRVAGAVPALRAELSGSAQRLAVPGTATAEAVEFSATADASGGLAAVGIDAAVAVRGLALTLPAAAGQRLETVDIAAAGTFRDLRTLALDRLSLASPLLEARATDATIDLGSGAVTAVIDAAVPRLAAIAALRPHLAAGALTLNSAVDGDLSSGRFGATSAGRLSGIRPAGGALPAGLDRIDFAGRVSAGPDALEVTALQIDSGLATVTADAALDNATGAVRLAASGAVARLDPLSAFAGIDLAGRAKFDISYTGASADAGTGTLALRLDGLRAGPAALDSLDVGLSAARRGGVTDGSLSVRAGGGGKAVQIASPYRLTPKTVRLSRLAIASTAVSGKGDITLPLDGTGIDGTLDLDVPDIGALAAVAGIGDLPVSGALGVALRPSPKRRGAIDVTLTGRRLSLAGTADPVTVEKLSVTATLRDLAAEIAGDAKATADGILIGARRIERLSATARTAGGGALDVDATATGIAGAGNTARVAGRVALRGGKTDIRLSSLDGTIGRHRLRLDRPARVVLADAGPTLEIPALRLGAGRISVEASLAGEALAARVSMADLPLALAGDLGLAPVAAGTLAATATLRGTPAAPEGDLEATVAGLRVAGPDAGDLPVVAARMNATLRSGVLEARGEVTSPKLPALKFAGRAGSAAAPVAALGDGTPLEFRVDGGGRLGPLVAALLPDGDRADGTIEIALGLGGTIGAPDLKGTVALTDGRYESGLTGARIAALELRLAANGRTVEIVRLRGTDSGSGTLSGSGRFDLSDPAAIAGRADLEVGGFRVARRDDAIVDASGKFRLEASADVMSLSGQARVDSADILIPDRLPGSVYEIEVEEIRGGRRIDVGKDDATAAPAIPMKLDLTVDVPGRAFVRGRGLTSEWRGNVRIEGETEDPRITGAFTIVNGTFAFAGKRFDITEGRVTLPPGEDGDPQLNVAAETRAGDILAKVAVEGPASAPKFTVSSQPSLPREEVLSRILFGKSSAHLSPVQAAQLAESAATISGASGSGGIFDRVRRATGLDVLDVEAKGDSPTGSTLKAGKYVADGVLVTAGQGLTPGTGKVGVEIEVTPYLSIDTQAGSNASSSVGVNLKYDF